MKIKKMTATFGRLEGEVLELREGLNVLELPNEGGKSTWCAFLRAMFYGIPTRERDTRTALAEKNRYQPWSGSPMAGEMLLTWGGRDLILRRSPKGASPFGGFQAVYADTNEPVPGLTGENCGQVLLGVSREVFQRSAFVGQSGAAVDGDPELERRIAALVSSGEETVSYTEAEKALRGWLNRRRHNQTGLIPRLEGELEEVERQLSLTTHTLRRAAEAQVQVEELERRKASLEAEHAAQRARQLWFQAEQHRSAAAGLAEARAEVERLEGEAGPLPSKEALRSAQEDLAYLKTLEANIKEAQNQRGPAREAVDRAEEAARDPLFPDMGPDQAWQQASGDAARARELEKGKEAVPTVSGALLRLAALCFGGAAAFSGQLLFLAAAGLGAAGGACFLLAARRAKGRRLRERAQLLARYGADYPDDILARANAYREKWVSVEEARRGAEAVESSIAGLTARREALWRQLLDFVRPFAPTVRDQFGVSAALSRALSYDERLSTARVRLEGAEKLAASLPAPQGEAPETAPPPSPHTAQQTAAALSAVSGELSRLQAELAHIQGQRSALGDPVELEARREALEAQLEQRRLEHRALSAALEVLGQANEQLRARFSPALDRRAGELFSALTGGKYDAVSLTRELDASAREAGAVLPHRALSLSQGTVDQLYLAVRLAVCELALPAEDPAPLVLDDTLANFDDRRAALALELLQALSRDRQILLFTCHSREKALLAARG